MNCNSTSRVAAYAVALAVVGAAALPALGDQDFIIPNVYHAQETTFYCGPAAIQMMLDTPNVLNNYVNPVLPTQTALFNTAQVFNYEPWYTSPAGMTADLNIADGGFHNYAWYSTFTRNQNSRTIANALNDYGIPGSVLIRGGQHWVDINGVRTTGNIGRNQAYTIEAFYGRDPWAGAGSLNQGFQNFELTYSNNPRSAWARLFTPVTTSVVWGGKFVSVLDPLGPELPDDGTFDATPLAPPTIAEILDPNVAAADAAADEGADAGLTGSSGFTGGSFSAVDAMMMHYSTDPADEGDWIVPYEGPGGANDVTGAVAIDADTGAIDYAVWGDPGEFESLSALDASFANIFSDLLVNDSNESLPEPATLACLLPAMGMLWVRRHRGVAGR